MCASPVFASTIRATPPGFSCLGVHSWSASSDLPCVKFSLLDPAFSLFTDSRFPRCDFLEILTSIPYFQCPQAPSNPVPRQANSLFFHPTRFTGLFFFFRDSALPLLTTLLFRVGFVLSAGQVHALRLPAFRHIIFRFSKISEGCSQFDTHFSPLFFFVCLLHLFLVDVLERRRELLTRPSIDSFCCDSSVFFSRNFVRSDPCPPYYIGSADCPPTTEFMFDL